MSILSYDELNSVWETKLRLEREKRRLVDLKVCAVSMTPILDGMPHATALESKVERITLLIADTEQTIKDMCQSLVQRKFELLTRLQALPLNELQQRVLSYHYVACLRFSEIAKMLSFTKDYVNKLHNRGLRALGLDVDEMNKFKQSSIVRSKSFKAVNESTLNP